MGSFMILWSLFGIFLNFTFLPLHFFATLLTGCCLGGGIYILLNEYALKIKEEKKK